MNSALFIVQMNSLDYILSKTETGFLFKLTSQSEIGTLI